MDTLDLIHAIASNDALKTEAAFKAVISEKIAVYLDTMRESVASSMFDSVEEIDEAKAPDPGKALAKSIASKHKNMKVSSFGKEHYIHHKDDEDGADGTVKIHHEGGQFHMHHESGGVAGGETKHSGSAEEVSAKAHKAISGN
jgi:hypothetical protein